MNITEASHALSLSGIGIFIGLVLLPHLFMSISHKASSIIGYSIMLIMVLAILLNHQAIVYLCIVISAAFFGLAAVNLLALFSKETSSKQQGWIMGVTGSIVALTGALGSLLVGTLSNLSINAPYIFSLIMIFLGLGFLFKIK